MVRSASLFLAVPPIGLDGGDVSRALESLRQRGASASVSSACIARGWQGPRGTAHRSSRQHRLRPSNAGATQTRPVRTPFGGDQVSVELGSVASRSATGCRDPLAEDRRGRRCQDAVRAGDWSATRPSVAACHHVDCAAR